ncbi:unnamed protein product [Ceratitis capitata]|uniref:(Mediterranean fruit fly) hypothetical protein n=1 Tax=Ceratitis capitata TaxID=7213 RepID=A0A811UY27_CERCA|nr:unnamed protein product [Ceratitis capitata]
MCYQKFVFSVTKKKTTNSPPFITHGSHKWCALLWCCWLHLTVERAAYLYRMCKMNGFCVQLLNDVIDDDYSYTYIYVFKHKHTSIHMYYSHTYIHHSLLFICLPSFAQTQKLRK